MTHCKILISILAVAFGLSSVSGNTKNAQATLARLADYLPHSSEAEAALARSAAPPSLSSKADILVFGPKGYEVQSKGNNGFVCFVERSWAKDPGDPEFWDTRMRAPTCMNPAAARSILVSYLERTKWVLDGASEAEVRDRIQRSVKSGAIAPPQAGAMSFMLSKQQFLTGNQHAWYPHVMFYFPSSVPAGNWGANLDGSPVISSTSPFEPVTVFMVPVSRWSDGSPATAFPH